MHEGPLFGKKKVIDIYLDIIRTNYQNPIKNVYKPV